MCGLGGATCCGATLMTINVALSAVLVGAGTFVIVAFSFPTQQLFGSPGCTPTSDCVNCTTVFDNFECSAENFVQIMNRASGLEPRIIVSPILASGCFLLLSSLIGFIAIIRRSSGCGCCFNLLHIIWFFVVLALFLLVSVVFSAVHDPLIRESLISLIDSMHLSSSYRQALAVLMDDIFPRLSTYIFLLSFALLVLSVLSMTWVGRVRRHAKRLREVNPVHQAHSVHLAK